MKIIALLPVKNEAWALPSYLSSVQKIADQIIALDDSSIDGSSELLTVAGVTIIKYNSSTEKVVDMGKRRSVLLEAGRAANGTHFIWLDADETFSSDFISHARETITQLKPGQKMTLRWVHPWKSTEQYNDGKTSPFGYIWKDFIVCDDKNSIFEKKFLSEARTPGDCKNCVILPEHKGVVLHWQFSNWDVVQMKQAWYRCTELIEGSRSAKRINNMYSTTLDINTTTSKIPERWVREIKTPISIPTGKHLEQIKKYFTDYGVEFFEPLQIWHIPELRKIFIESTNREPRPQTFPSWLVELNKLRHKFLNR